MDFTLNFTMNLQNDHVYDKGIKSDVAYEELSTLTNKLLRKSNDFSQFSRYGKTKYFFVN